MYSKYDKKPPYYNFRKSYRGTKNPEHTLLRATRGIEDKEREKIIDFAEKKGIASRKIEEEFMPVYKKSDEPTKKALLSGRISVEDVKMGTQPLDLKSERVADDVASELLDDFSSFTDHTNELVKEMNIQDLMYILQNI